MTALAYRNGCLRHARGRWIFWLDADDFLDDENRAKLRRLLATPGDKPAAYVMKCLCLAESCGRYNKPVPFPPHRPARG